MKKTVQVNLSGQIFTLDDDAYDSLAKYLHQISLMYEGSNGKEEIIQDIEARIAELFLERLQEDRQVIALKDVDSIIAILGKPEQFESEPSDDSEASKQFSPKHNNSSKRLYRDSDNKILGGVCAGFGHYFGIDPVWIRLLFAAAVIFAGTGFLLYFILWIVIPSAKTTAEKLNMKGEPINIGNIGRSIENELNDLGKRVSGNGNQSNKILSDISKGIERFFQAFFEVLKALINALAKVLGSLFLISGLIAIVALGAAFFGFADVLHWGSYEWHNSMTIYELGRLIFESDDLFTSFLIGLILLVTVPIIGLGYGGFVLLFPRSKVPYLGATLMATWFIGIAITLVSVLSFAKEFSKTETVKTEILFPENAREADTIFIALGFDPFNLQSDNAYSENRNDFLMKSTEDKIMLGNISFDIKKTDRQQPYIEIYKSAKSNAVEHARSKSERIEYQINQDSSRLVLDAYYQFPSDDLFRDQDLKVVLRLPAGKAIYLEKNTTRIIDNIQNIQNIYDPDMANHVWIMTNIGLSCVDCHKDTSKILPD